jgi:hypothetical protein
MDVMLVAGDAPRLMVSVPVRGFRKKMLGYQNI